MKKILLVAALGVAGIMSAKEIKIETREAKEEVEKAVLTEMSQDQKSNSKVKLLLNDITWIGVSTWCGKVFYLNANDYSSYEQLEEHAAYFTNQQCAGASTFTPQFT